MPPKSTRPTTSPSSPPSPDANAQASSTASAPASDLGGFISDPGPAFEPAPDAPAPGELKTPAPDVAWNHKQVRSMLEVQGRMTHGLIGVGEQDWLHTEADLAAIAPPLTRILNRYPATAAAAAVGDEMLLVTGVGGYAIRSYLERKQELERRASQPPGPLTGEPAAASTAAPADTDLEALPDASDLGVPINPVSLEEV